MQYWSTLDVIKQVAGELGLVAPTSIPDQANQQVGQLLALLNSAGNELMLYYPWEQFSREWRFDTVDGQDEYTLPPDWSYFVDQTQWDQTNHWPLLGPKSPQEWAWLKGGVLAAAPRMRYRIAQNKFKVWPVPGATPFTFSMEYISNAWVRKPDNSLAAMTNSGGDILEYHPWLLVKFVKMKFYELRGFDTNAVRTDFLRIFNGLTGKDKGAPKLSLSPRVPPLFIGPWSIPDGSWDVNPGMTP